jgi:dienelactone hydrolase
MPIFATQTRATPLLCAAAMLISHLLFSGHLSGVQGPQVTGTDRHINDVRTEPLKDLNGYFPMVVPKSKAQWLLRADRVRQQVKVALGLWPPPAKTPLNPVIYGKIDCGDYTVEKTFFESMPGFYVTGSLYRPKTASGKLPGILCPHGHWANGRFYDAGEANAKSQIAQGAESDLETARNPIQARCVHLARMGCVVFQYDMIGYADSVQISSEIAHRFAKQRPAYNTPEKWGLFSPQAELHLQSVMGLQSWNSIRCLDFLESLPDVDDNRLAVTGASGGGTQTFLLAAIDARIQVSFPAVMVSTAMQGGCTCENCTLLRVTTGNIELAALFAPKPQGVTAANDWTKEMRTKGFPELKGLYQLMGSPENIMMVDRTEFGHNYNKVSRTAMYRWFQKHLNLTGSVKERPYRRLTQQELTVWGSEHPKPSGKNDFERRLLNNWTEQSKQRILSSPERSKLIKQGWEGIFQRELPASGDVEFETVIKNEKPAYWEIAGIIGNKKQGEEFPATFIHPKKWNKKVVIVTSDSGKNCLYDQPKELTESIEQLVNTGHSVVSADLLFQGEFNRSTKPAGPTRKVENPREAAAYTFGYNHTLLAQRTHDLVNLITLVAHHQEQPESIILVGFHKTGAISAAAGVIASDLVDHIIIEKQGLSSLMVDKIHDPYFLPGSQKYFGIWGMLLAGKSQVSVLGGTPADIPEDLKELPWTNLALKPSDLVKVILGETKHPVP